MFKKKHMHVFSTNYYTQFLFMFKRLAKIFIKIL